MEWKLTNPRNGIHDVTITKTIGGRYFLNLRYSWMAAPEPVDGYMFPSDSAAKRHYSTYYQSFKKNGQEKPRWKKF